MTEQNKLNRYIFAGKVTAVITKDEGQGVVQVELNALVASNVTQINHSILSQGTAALTDTFMQSLPEEDRPKAQVLRVTLLNIINTGPQTDEEWNAKPVGYELSRVEGEG